MARAARGVLPSESVVLISISYLKMSRASTRSAGERPSCASAPAEPSVPAKTVTFLTARI